LNGYFKILNDQRGNQKREKKKKKKDFDVKPEPRWPHMSPHRGGDAKRIQTLLWKVIFCYRMALHVSHEQLEYKVAHVQTRATQIFNNFLIIFIFLNYQIALK